MIVLELNMLGNGEFSHLIDDELKNILSTSHMCTLVFLIRCGCSNTMQIQNKITPNHRAYHIFSQQNNK